MKRAQSLLIALSMLACMLSGFSIQGAAAERRPESKLISVAYSETLELYVTVANDGQTYTSGDGLHWGPGAKLAFSEDIGSLKGNAFYVTPTAVIWNPDLKEFALAAGSKLYRSADGFNWGDPIEPKAGDAALVIHTLFWDGTKYWAATKTGGQAAAALDDTLASWKTYSTGSGSQQPIDGFAVTESGRLFVCTTVNNARTLFYTDDDGQTWSDGTVSGNTPYRTTSLVYLPKIGKIALAGGNGSNSASTGDAAIGRADAGTGLAEAKLQLKADANNASPVIPVIAEMAVHDSYDSQALVKEEIVAVSYTGMISYRLVGDANDLTKNRKWKEVLPAAGTEKNTAGLIDIIHGRDGFVAVGGDPSNSDRGAESACGTAVFIPDDYTQGYQIASFDDMAVQVPTTLFVSGQGEVEIPVSGSATAAYRAAVRDQAGREIQAPSNSIVWTIDGEPKNGISIADGVLTVTPEAEQQRIIIHASDRADASITGSMEVLISTAPQPTAIQLNGPAALVKSETELRTAAYTATVLDQLGRPVPAENNMDKVVWSLEYPAENPAAGLSIDPDTGILSVPNTASAGDARVVTSSAYPQTPTIKASYPIHITAIGAVTLAGPKEYRHYFRQCTKTPCTYTFTPTVQDAEGNPITEECEYSIVEPHHNPGVSITNSGKGDCVLTLRSNTVSDTLTLKASVKHAPDIIGTFTLSLVDTMVPNGDLIQREDGSNTPLYWTKLGELGPSSLDTSENHGRWSFDLNSATSQQVMSFASEPFSVAAGAVYQFGFRSQGVQIAEHDKNFTPQLYMMVTFHNENGKQIGGPVLIYDTKVSDGADHTTAVDFYQEIKVPANAVSAKATMSATPPMEFKLFDIGCYPLIDSGTISIDGPAYLEAGEKGQLAVTASNLFYHETSIPLPDGVKWFLTASYPGVSIDMETGELQTTAEAEEGTVGVRAVVSGNTSIMAEKDIRITKPAAEVAAEEIIISKGPITAGGQVEASARVTNTTEGAAFVTLIAAVYDQNGMLAGISIGEPAEIQNGGIEQTVHTSVDIPQGKDTTGWSAKAFLWNSKDGMVPVKKKS